MISLGENYKHSGLIPLKSLGVLPFISMGALPSPYNGRSHLSAGIDAVPFALAAMLLTDTWKRGSCSCGADRSVIFPRAKGGQRRVTVTAGGREGHHISPHLLCSATPFLLGQLRVLPARAPKGHHSHQAGAWYLLQRARGPGQISPRTKQRVHSGFEIQQVV